jgi:hypothetical protein
MTVSKPLNERNQATTHAQFVVRPSEQQLEWTLDLLAHPREYPASRHSFGDSLETALDDDPEVRRFYLSLPSPPLAPCFRSLAACLRGYRQHQANKADPGEHSSQNTRLLPLEGLLSEQSS